MQNAKPKLNAHAACENAHLVAQDLVTRIGELLFDLPAPDNELTEDDDDEPNSGRRRNAVAFIRERGDIVYLLEFAVALRVNKAFTSRLLARAVLSRKVRNRGHQKKGWIARK
jgi:hypothetical protein